MNNIITKTFEKEMLYENTVILKYKIEYPEITNSRYPGARVFNKFNLERATNLKEYCETKLFNDAKELYDYNRENNYPIMVYEIIMEYNITYNNKNTISLYSDVYMFTGGAHGNTTRESQNWNLQNGKQISLASFYPDNPYFVIDILKEINSQIKVKNDANPGEYFDNYCSLVLETFNPNNYYITNDYLTIFFNQYDIAPYSTGIPTFNIVANRSLLKYTL